MKSEIFKNEIEKKLQQQLWYDDTYEDLNALAASRKQAQKTDNTHWIWDWKIFNRWTVTTYQSFINQTPIVSAPLSKDSKVQTLDWD